MSYRSAITGRYVTVKHANRNPKTTVWETPGNVHKRKLPKGHRLVKRHKPVVRNHRAREYAAGRKK